MSDSYEEHQEWLERCDKATAAARARRLRPATRRGWERVARKVWSGEEDVYALRGCPLPVGLLGALQAYEALCREYDSGEKEVIPARDRLALVGHPQRFDGLGCRIPRLSHQSGLYGYRLAVY